MGGEGDGGEWKGAVMAATLLKPVNVREGGRQSRGGGSGGRASEMLSFLLIVYTRGREAGRQGGPRSPPFPPLSGVVTSQSSLSLTLVFWY